MLKRLKQMLGMGELAKANKTLERLKNQQAIQAFAAHQQAIQAANHQMNALANAGMSMSQAQLGPGAFAPPGPDIPLIFTRDGSPAIMVDHLCRLLRMDRYQLGIHVTVTATKLKNIQPGDIHAGIVVMATEKNLLTVARLCRAALGRQPDIGFRMLDLVRQPQEEPSPTTQAPQFAAALEMFSNGILGRPEGEAEDNPGRACPPDEQYP